MTASLLLLTVCYALLAMLVLAFCLYTKWRFWWKTLVILAFVALAMANYDGLAGLLGYPTPGRLPQRFIYHSAVVAQPNTTTGNKGAIYLWATELGPDGPAASPRAYELPYEKENATALGLAAKRNSDGITQLGAIIDPPTREGGSMFSRLLLDPKQVKLKLNDKPDPALPEK